MLMWCDFLVGFWSQRCGSFLQESKHTAVYLTTEHLGKSWILSLTQCSRNLHLTAHSIVPLEMRVCCTYWCVCVCLLDREAHCEWISDSLWRLNFTVQRIYSLFHTECRDYWQKSGHGNCLNIAGIGLFTLLDLFRVLCLHSHTLQHPRIVAYWGLWFMYNLSPVTPSGYKETESCLLQ